MEQITPKAQNFHFEIGFSKAEPIAKALNACPNADAMWFNGLFDNLFLE